MEEAGAKLDIEECIAGGGVAVFPTDTLYGIGCRPDDETAVAEVAAATNREHPDLAFVGLGVSGSHALDMISEIVKDPETARKLTPTDLYARRPLCCHAP